MRIVDVATGTNPGNSRPASIRWSLALAPDFLAFARRQLPDPRVRFAQGTADALPLPDESADVVASSLVLNFVPDAEAALREMIRVVRGGGSVTAAVWDYRDGMQFLRRF